MTAPHKQSLKVDLAGLELEHPVINASGTFDLIAAVEVFGDSLFEKFPFSCYVTKTITLEPRAGNPPKRLSEAPAGLINSIGLPNRGLEGFLRSDLPRLAELPVPLMVSVAGFSGEEFIRLVKGVCEATDVDAVELNISCPNVHSGCVYGDSSEETEGLLRELKPLSEKPIVVKLTPNAADIKAVAQGAERGGASAISLINTVKAFAYSKTSDLPALGAGSGGLSGPAIRLLALELVKEVCEAVSVPVVAMGGIASGQDALAFMKAGARCVAIGTENFRDPLAAARVLDELKALGSGLAITPRAV